MLLCVAMVLSVIALHSGSDTQETIISSTTSDTLNINDYRIIDMDKKISEEYREYLLHLTLFKNEFGYEIDKELTYTIVVYGEVIDYQYINDSILTITKRYGR